VVKVDCGHCYPKPDGTWLDSWGGGRAWHWWLENPTDVRRIYPVAALPYMHMDVPLKQADSSCPDESANESDDA